MTEFRLASGCRAHQPEAAGAGADGRRSRAVAGAYSYADIAFYMAQLFGARKGAPMTDETPRLLAWRERITARPAVRKVAGAMAGYLASIGEAVPDFLHEVDSLPSGADGRRKTAFGDDCR
ncbi:MULTISPECIES: glutathione binding-like protein [Burkholderia]|uniref:glutathione binding-like protein n=1 Tax=Burkholderia TaxID=32008 RepID=UPI001CF4144E|nr:glutathione binding-like protein [Burkholderia cepacia]MCA8055661.1 hypothetical protein [Burkholderia cepacia]MCA8135916.1 hypothetical protein [Burkholderia cepacia]MDN7634806.1 glutathione binding-like protein [Burkholderia cepacia]MDN7762048.1 glutathione binding-like protein [Burkholderia cepacia]MDN7888324.1 glutathione binding-like protein [Burkholderia cepacia]